MGVRREAQCVSARQSEVTRYVALRFGNDFRKHFLPLLVEIACRVFPIGHLRVECCIRPWVVTVRGEVQWRARAPQCS